MLVYVTAAFEDREHGGAMRIAGSLLKVSDSRGKQIIKAGYGRAIELIDLMPVEEPAAEEKEAPEAPEAKEAPKKTSKK